MFLLPAFGAGICDILILYIHSHRPMLDSEEAKEIALNVGLINIYAASYLSTLSLLRLFLLAVPMLYRTYTGTSVKFPILYYLIHGTSTIIVLGHMLCIILLDPDSLASLYPAAAADRRRISGQIKMARVLNYRLAAIRSVWFMLILSLVSISLHVLILLYVRSTAPNTEKLHRERHRRRPGGEGGGGASGGGAADQRRVLAYYAYDRFRRGNARGPLSIDNVNSNENNDAGLHVINGISRNKEERSDLALTSNHALFDTESQHDDDNQEYFSSLLSLDVLSGNSNETECVDNTDDFPPWPRLHRTSRKATFRGYDEFVSELKTRLEESKRVWSGRLEDATQWIHKQIQLQSNQPNAASLHRTNISFLQHIHLTPFRALVQLYGYKEVFKNYLLDRAFSDDNENTTSALTFYAPQLLSFLLHGAFFNSPLLEKWILDKCRHNIFFAHRCFWFLRSWCLGSGSHSRQIVDATENGPMHQRSNSFSMLGFADENETKNTKLRCPPKSPSSGGLSQLHGSGSNLYSNSHAQSGLEGRRIQSSIGFREWTTTNDEKPAGSKYPPEEHSLIESLLFKIVDNGAEAAWKLQYGPHPERLYTDDDDDDDGDDQPLSVCEVRSIVGNRNGMMDSPEPLSQHTNLDLIPFDPDSGSSSLAHLDVVKANHTYGFLPLDSPPQNPQTEPLPTASELFLSTPRFLDALITIADDLKAQPRSNRKTELRRRLRLLERELLPSNTIYVPVNNMQHRVWRIVADESIALSTKERVPCIITLEVISYDDNDDICDYGTHSYRVPANQKSAESSPKMFAGSEHLSRASSSARKLLSRSGSLGPFSRTDDDILLSWYKSDRPPQRHNTLLEKVSTYTQMGFRKMSTNAMGLPGVSGQSMLQDIELGTNPRIRREGTLENPHDANPIGDLPDRLHIASRFRDPLPGSDSPSTENMQTPPGRPVSGANQPVSQPSSRGSSRPPSPLSTMGQWSTSTAIRNDSSAESEIMATMAGFESVHHERPLQVSERSSHLETSDSSPQFGSTAGIRATTVVSPIPIRLGSTKSPEMKGEGEKDTTPKKGARPPLVVFKEDWNSKEERLRSKSAYGAHKKWHLLPLLIKSNDDLRQEQLASQLIHQMASILARGKIPVWLYPYEIIALTDRGGVIEAIPDTISIDSLKRNNPGFVDLKTFFLQHFGHSECDEYAGARANFVESVAAYSIVCFLLQIKDRHNGNILLDNKGHLIHIDFGFFFLSSPGKNSGFESAPFKLTRDFVDLMDGPESRTFAKFRDLCVRTFLELRKHSFQILLLVEMLMEGNEDLTCFCGRPEDAVHGLRERFRSDLNDRACVEYVNALVDESLENWRTRWYDRYQRFCVGVL